MTAILKRPTVEEKTGLCVEQVFDVEEKLPFCFFDVVGSIQDFADLREW